MFSAADREYSKYTTEAVSLLGEMIRQGRKRKKLSEADFAKRCGISRATLRKIESGNPHCEIGFAFEAAFIAGIELFDTSRSADLTHAKRIIVETTALLPSKIRTMPLPLKDDF